MLLLKKTKCVSFQYGQCAWTIFIGSVHTWEFKKWILCVTGSLLLESKILPDTAYQKQQVILTQYEHAFFFEILL